ncbi:hypothetical protein BZL29_7981 [Mycobacterium kansasii]|uniref:Uncharacterized protein n=1 Tax=Mycobacterium kansasii TaxID=1768 RepID=A0A1V3WDV1_MYCKA|nr:hypothetical protein BZL29_7981 [Mycobacterium kansasii]
MKLAVANDVERIAAGGNDPILMDFFDFFAQYQRAYVAALPNHGSGDAALGLPADESLEVILTACHGAGV